MDVLELNKLSKHLHNYLASAGIDEEYLKFALTFTWIIITFIVTFLSNKVIKRYLIKALEKLIRKTKTKFDDYFIERKVFNRLSNCIPVLIVYALLGVIFGAFPDSNIVVYLQKILSSVIVFIILWTFNAFLSAITDIYNSFPYSRERPIRGLIQVFQIVAAFITTIIVISILFDINVSKIMAGLGAVAAVLLLVFKDTILGFVASIQLSANKMVSPGDWITMPSYKTDGTVLDITLNTVKIQNWDKTITTVPTYKLVDDSFINWKGMKQSGGRRIKRSINIDMRTIKFCTTEMIERFKKIRLLKDYITHKEQELLEHNQKEGGAAIKSLANGRRLTNIGIFRHYLQAYLREHPMVHNNMTFMVRQLQSTEKGQPIEIYAFSKDQEWVNFESIQSDIFDHVLAVVQEFELKVYQLPSGNDLTGLKLD